MIGESDKVLLNFQNGEQLAADYVLLAVGLAPNTELAEKSGLGIFIL
jgi:NAD(P)H-nitrite reductase large subunit